MRSARARLVRGSTDESRLEDERKMTILDFADEGRNGVAGLWFRRDTSGVSICVGVLWWAVATALVVSAL